MKYEIWNLARAKYQFPSVCVVRQYHIRQPPTDNDINYKDRR
jgi:hypothetical protein